MDRAALALWLATELDRLLAEAGIEPTDTPDGLAPVLDTVERIASGNASIGEAWLPPLARYVALDRIVTRLATNMDVGTGGDSYRLSQQFAHAKALRDEAKAAVAWMVEPVQPGTGSGGGGIVTLDLNFLTGGDEWL